MRKKRRHFILSAKLTAKIKCSDQTTVGQWSQFLQSQDNKSNCLFSSSLRGGKKLDFYLDAPCRWPALNVLLVKHLGSCLSNSSESVMRKVVPLKRSLLFNFFFALLCLGAVTPNGVVCIQKTYQAKVSEILTIPQMCEV